MNINRLKEDIFNAHNPQKQCKAAYQMRYVKNDPEIISILFGACYEARDIKLQQEAVKSLGVLKPAGAMSAFIKSTYNEDSEKRRRAYFHLGTLGNPKAIDEVYKGFDDPDDKVRQGAVIAFGRLGKDHNAINALKRLINEYEPDFIKRAAIQSIENIKYKLYNNKNNNKNNNINKKSFNKPEVKKQNYRKKSFNKSEYSPIAF